MKRYNHMFSICFTVDTDNDSEHITEKELIAGLYNRLQALEANAGEIIEACGAPHDTIDSKVLIQELNEPAK
jgi:hypothetical protein